MVTQMKIQQKAGLGTLIWRFFSGQHMDGIERMNTSWARRGKTPEHRDNWWNRKARLERAAWRNAIFWPSCASVYGYFVARTLTLTCVSLALLYLLIKLGIGVNGKIWRTIQVGHGEYVVTDKMVHPHLTHKWERFKSAFIRSYDADTPADSVPPEVLKALQAEAAEAGEAPIISAQLVTVKGKRASK